MSQTAFASYILFSFKQVSYAHMAELTIAELSTVL